MSSVALVIIYNHKFDRNIEPLEELYGRRFSHIYHLVPFYTGTKPNVIPVYENSFYFQGYVAQGLKLFYREEYQHYLFIGDDLFLNPVVNEKNYTEHFKLSNSDCFFPGYNVLHEMNKTGNRWERVIEAFHYKPNNIYGAETANELPTYEAAKKKFEAHGLKVESLSYDQVHSPLPKPEWKELKKMKIYLTEEARRRKYRNAAYNSYYPLAGGYSDIFVISSDAIKNFAHACGVFATGKLFVEFAIPTAMILSAGRIVTEKELALRGKPLWSAEELALLDQYHYVLKELLEKFPVGLLYLHPVKLSKWKIGPDVI